MIKAEQVPNDAMNALLQALRLRKSGRAAIAAALNAWPGVEHQNPNEWSNKPHLILPLPQETGDE